MLPPNPLYGAPIITILLTLKGNDAQSRGKVRDSTLEFEGVHLTQKTIFVTDSKNTFTFFLSFVVFILRLFSKNRGSSCFLGSFNGFY